MNERLPLELFDGMRVVIVGVGTVGSPIAHALAQSAIGNLRLIDGDRLETRNLHRHFLRSEHLGWNKTAGMADALKIPGLQVDAVPRHLTSEMSNDEVDALLQDADVIIAATDRRDAQRRIARRARVLDIPALFPGVYAVGGGEVVLQRSWRFPCYMCWDGWRRARDYLRESGILHDEVQPIVTLTVELVRGILDQHGPEAVLLNQPPGLDNLPQLYVLNRHALAIKDVQRRPKCPVCGGDPVVNFAVPGHGVFPELRGLIEPAAQRETDPHALLDAIERSAFEIPALDDTQELRAFMRRSLSGVEDLVVGVAERRRPTRAAQPSVSPFIAGRIRAREDSPTSQTRSNANRADDDASILELIGGTLIMVVGGIGALLVAYAGFLLCLGVIFVVAWLFIQVLSLLAGG